MISTRRKLFRLYEGLYQHFGPRHWWPADGPWEMMLGAILAQNTAWTNVEKAIHALRQAGALSMGKISTLPRRRLERLIRSSGYFRQKAERLQTFARYLKDNPRFYQALSRNYSHGNKIPPRPPFKKGGVRGDLDVRFRKGDIQNLRVRLLSLKGIGPETADSILLYAGGYPIFVVDAYTRRIGRRIGLYKYNDYHDVQAYFERSLPRNAELFNEFHALLVMLGKHFCARRRPRCAPCPLITMCAHGRKNVKKVPKVTSPARHYSDDGRPPMTQWRAGEVEADRRESRG